MKSKWPPRIDKKKKKDSAKVTPIKGKKSPKSKEKGEKLTNTTPPVQRSKSDNIIDMDQNKKKIR